MTTTILQSHHQTQTASVIGILKASDGSARFTIEDEGGTSCTVVSSVNGPVEVRIRDETIGRATLDFQIHPASGLGSPKERFMEELISKSLESTILLGLHPRSQVLITSQLITPVSITASTHRYYSEDRHASTRDATKREMILSIAGIVNSISLALLDANFSTNSVLAATTFQHKECYAALAYSFPSEKLVLLESIGTLNREDLKILSELGLERARAVYHDIRKTMEEKIDREIAWQRNG